MRVEYSIGSVNDHHRIEIEPTHYADSGHSVIDLAVISDLSYFDSFRVCNDTYCFSNHRPIECIIVSSIAQNCNSVRFTHESWRCKEAKKEDWERYQTLLTTNLNTLTQEYPFLIAQNPVIQYEDVTQDYINDLWQRLYEAVMDAARMSIGKKLLKPQHKFWFNHPEIHRLLVEQRKLRNKYEKLRC